MTLRTVSPHASRVVRPDRGQLPQQVRDPLQLHEVELDVEPGGQVAPAPAVAVGDAAQQLQLLGVDRAVGHLDPHHLVVAALALAVDAVVEPEHPEGVLVDPAGQVVRQQPVELLDVGRGLGIDDSGLHGTSQPKMTVIINFCGFLFSGPAIPRLCEMDAMTVHRVPYPGVCRPVRFCGLLDRPSIRGRRSTTEPSAAQQVGDLEGQVERLAGVEPGVAGGGVAQLQLVLEDLVGAAQALGDVVAGQLDVHAARPGPFGPAGGEELPDLGRARGRNGGSCGRPGPVKVLPCIGSQAHTTGWPAPAHGSQQRRQQFRDRARRPGG